MPAMDHLGFFLLRAIGFVMTFGLPAFLAFFVLREMWPQSVDPDEWDADEAQEQIKKDPHLQIVDVRTAEEFEAAHLPGALNLPFDALPEKLASLDRQRSVMVYCEDGERSGRARKVLEGAGFAHVHD